MQWKITDGQNQTKKLLNMKLRHAGITVTTVIKQQLEFHYFIDIIWSLLNFAILIFACPIFREYYLVLAKLSEKKVI